MHIKHLNVTLMRTNKDLTLAVLVTIKRLSSVLGFRVQGDEKKYNN